MKSSILRRVKIKNKKYGDWLYKNWLVKNNSNHIQLSNW